MSLILTEKLIQRQINHWNRFRDFLKDEDPTGPVKTGPCITISRLAGSGGRTLAVALADRLQLALHGQDLVDRIARERNLDKSVVEQMDESAVSQTDLWVKGVLNRRIFLKDEYRTSLFNVVNKLAATGNAVFLGRGAHLILDDKATLRIRLVASWENRLARITERTGLGREEAVVLLKETDRNRADFIHKVFGIDPNDPTHFDLVINSDRMKPECILETVTLALIGAQTGGRARMHSQV